MVNALESVGPLKLNDVLNEVISRSNVDSGLLSFNPEANTNGTGQDSFWFYVSEDTQDSLSNYTMTIDVNPFNGILMINIPIEVNINEDTCLYLKTVLGQFELLM